MTDFDKAEMLKTLQDTFHFPLEEAKEMLASLEENDAKSQEDFIKDFAEWDEATLGDWFGESIAISNFVKRQTSTSRFSHFEGTDEELVDLIHKYFVDGKKGYRNGVLLIPVPPEKFYSGIIQLEPGDRLVGKYEARQEGEDPRKHTSVASFSKKKMPAKRVDLVLYHHEVLKENNEESSSANWELISINASPTEEEVPIPVGALIANHLELSGGTATNMTDEEFVKQLKTSVLWWADKAMAKEEE